MSERIKPRQQEILKLLLENRAGLSIDELASALDISRNAVQQHLTTLEKDSYVQMGRLSKTAGRPVRRFVLTEAGINSFPKQYAWFSALILTDLKNDMGSEAFQRYFHNLASKLAQNLLAQFTHKSTDERVVELLKVMDSLGFSAEQLTDSEHQDTIIEACNCIYHDLAQQHEEICQFDRTLMTLLLGKEIEQTTCMAKGEAICRFKILK